MSPSEAEPLDLGSQALAWEPVKINILGQTTLEDESLTGLKVQSKTH